jgi:hypothetical protein
MLTVPDNFADNWQIMTAEELAEHYNIATQTVTKLCRQLGLKRGSEKLKNSLRPKPDGFEEVAHLSEHALRLRFACGVHAVRRWRKEIGYVSPQNRAIDRAPSVLRMGVEDKSAVLAQKYLQKNRPVYRCDANGKFGGNTHWRCGRDTLTDAALVEKAKALGWDAGEWRRVSI